jgi:PHD/YefM family antitoxin component YafN of YafNO toxin-antitoxin module
MTTIPANTVRIPFAAREALGRREAVMVVSRGRPACVIVDPDAYEAGQRPIPGARRLRDALEILSSAPTPNEAFASDLEAIRASAGVSPLELGLD